jgi:hypothetical protein
MLPVDQKEKQKNTQQQNSGHLNLFNGEKAKK